MKLSIIIITYNADRYIADCLNSVLSSIVRFNDYEIIIFDNNSNDNTIMYIEDFLSAKIKIIREPINRGYSAAINKAVKIARFETILILNPDTVIENDAILKLFKKLNMPNVGAVGGKLLNKNKTFQVSSRRHFPTLGILLSYVFRLNRIFSKNKFFGKYNYTYLDENLQSSVDAVSGACMMFEKKIFNKLNGFDEIFFLYFEETDFCFRLKGLGLKVLYCPESQIIHYNNYHENYRIKNFYFYDSLEKFIYKHKDQIYLGLLVYYFAKLINNIFHLKRFLVPVR